jgi:hypothetical protein
MQANPPHPHAYVRYENNGERKEDFLFWKSLMTRSTAVAILDLVKAIIVSNRTEWSECVYCVNCTVRWGCVFSFELAHRFSDFDRLAKLGYLDDIFSHLNDSTSVSMEKWWPCWMSEWAGRVDQPNFDPFENLWQRNVASRHHDQSCQWTPACFEHQSAWILPHPRCAVQLDRKPHCRYSDEAFTGLVAKEKENRTDLSCDSTSKLALSQKYLTTFWPHVASN